MSIVVYMRQLTYNETIYDKYKIKKCGDLYGPSKKKLSTKLLNGYLCCNIKPNGSYVTILIHRAVACTYIKNPKNFPCVNHIDENKQNNNMANLEWVTQKENTEKHSKITSHVRKVHKLDDDNDIIDTFSSLTEAGSSIGLTRHAIRRVCLGQNKTAGGYKWKYDNEEYLHNIDVNLNEGKIIKEYPNYKIYTDGKIFSIQTKRYLKWIYNANGCPYVTLCNKNKAPPKRNHYINDLLKTYHPDINIIVKDDSLKDQIIT
jgi:hypothetical protein